MVKNITYKYLSVFLAFLVLFSTFSFAVEKHYCHDTLVDVSLFANAEKCSSESGDTMKKKSCCKDEVDVVEGQDELKIASFEDFDFEQQKFILSFAVSYRILFQSLPKETIPFKDYAPPKLVYDIQVLDQVFLI